MKLTGQRQTIIGQFYQLDRLVVEGRVSVSGALKRMDYLAYYIVRGSISRG